MIAPDQKRLVFGTRDADGATRLWIQDLDSPEPYPVPGTEGGLFPFWSPDGKFLGFFARGTLKVIEASRSPAPARTLTADILEARGGSWGEDGTILYAPGNVAPIMRVPAAGGKPAPATRLEGDEKAHRWPRFLPGGRRFLYEARKPGSGTGAAATLSRLTYLASLDGKEKRLVLTDATSLAYVSPGYLLFGRHEQPDGGRLRSRRLSSRGASPSCWRRTSKASPLPERRSSRPPSGCSCIPSAPGSGRRGWSGTTAPATSSRRSVPRASISPWGWRPTAARPSRPGPRSRCRRTSGSSTPPWDAAYD